jgi:hypothetical protein
LRSGCRDLAIRIVVASVAAVLTVLGVVLLFTVFVPSPGQPFEVEGVIKVLAACVAGYSFYLVGKSVWKDIKKRRPPAEPAEEPEDRGSSSSSGFGGG